jgi:uncharacterized membrane protein YhaH (DUF805 family)
VKYEISNIYLGFAGTLSLKNYWLFWNIPIILLVSVVYLLESQGIVLKSKFFQVTNILILWPFVATSIKRLHDMGKSGWWVLVNLIPIIGSIIFSLLLSCIPGEKVLTNYYKNKI